jgi:L-rhamnose-H+ transport protein
MNAEFFTGLAIVLGAGALQGTFVLPMMLTRKWAWEHNWAVFSLLGMLLFNWLIAACVIPDLPGVYRDTPAGNLGALLLFGGLWGAGAVLFGLGMERLGMALGYPVIMGLILSMGALIPLLLQNPAGLASAQGGLLLVAIVVTLIGIVLCSLAAARRSSTTAGQTAQPSARLATGLVIAMFAGVLSCFPNVGMNYADPMKEAAIRHGASETLAGNAAWALLFTAGFVVNFVYCAGLMLRRNNLRELGTEFLRNVSLIALMALMWIGSFYLYGIGAARLGRWGGIIGWPLFISLAIVVGNLWGLMRGEWSSAPVAARRRLALGLAVLLLAVALFGVSSALPL